MGLMAFDEAVVLVALGLIVWLGAFLAIRLEPSIRQIAGDRRLPTREEIFALLTGQVGSLASWMLGEQVMTALRFLFNGPAPSLAEGVSCALWTATAAAVVAPLWRQAAGANGGRVGQAALGLVAALPLCAGVGLLWGTVIAPLLGPFVSSDDRFQAALLVPASIFTIGFGGALVIQALRGEAGARPAMAQAAGLALVAWAAVGLYLIFDLAEGSTPGPGMGEVLAVGYGVFAALAWIMALRLIRQIPKAGIIATTLVLILLGVAMLVSVAIPTAVMGQPEGWDALVAVIMLPFALIGTGLTAFAIAPICRRLLGAVSREPAWRPLGGTEGQGTHR